jgi:hypothetical protein
MTWPVSGFTAYLGESGPAIGASLGREIDKRKVKQKADRINDPHGWAYEIERRADQRSLVGSVAFLISLILAANVWLLWKERDTIIDRVEQLERASRAEISLPPKGYRLVE